MKWKRFFKRTDPGRAARIALRLQSIRFRNIIENARTVMDLLADGREKMEGGYILDRHYVESLVDTVIEKAGMIVFDACVLVQDGGGTLYERFDALTLQAREMILSVNGGVENTHPGAMVDNEAGLEPEYKLLSRVLEWIDGAPRGSALPDSRRSMMELIRGIFDHVVLGCKNVPFGDDAMEILTCTSNETSNTIRIVDTDSGLVSSTSENITGKGKRDRLLRLLFTGVEAKEPVGGGGSKTTERGWIAVISGQHLSLHRMDTETPFRLEACLSSFPDEDIIFVYAGKGIDLKDAPLPNGFRVEETVGGTLAWLYDVEAEQLEHGLVRLGQIMFCGNARGLEEAKLR